MHDILCWEQSHIPRWDMFVRLRVYSYIWFSFGLTNQEPGTVKIRNTKSKTSRHTSQTFPSLLTSLWRHSFYFRGWMGMVRILSFRGMLELSLMADISAFWGTWNQIWRYFKWRAHAGLLFPRKISYKPINLTWDGEGQCKRTPFFFGGDKLLIRFRISFTRLPERNKK